METYKTSWVRRLVDNVWTKTFAFAHAKTVYTDYANKKTLADKLSGVDLEIAQQSTEMMDIKMLGWSVPRECPVQNEINGNQFIQKVGRVDLGSLIYVEHEAYGVFTEGIRSIIKIHLDIGTTSSGIYCNGYLPVSWGVLVGVGKTDTNHIADNGQGIIGFNTTLSKDKFQSKMKGKYLYYELATPITTTIDGNEIGEGVSDVRKETTVNLLKPTLQTTTQDGITCTNNGDGTYTLNGTANKEGFFRACDINLKLKTYRLLGCPVGGKNETYMLSIQLNGDTFDTFIDYGNGKSFTVSKVSSSYSVMFYFKNGTVFNNLVFKPMLTSNLSATYDDFVPYTGDTGSLNGDVADLRSDVDNIYNYEATEKEIGKFEGKTLYKSTGIFDFSTPITFNAGDKKAFGSSAGIYALASSSNVGFKLNEISKVLNSECFAETSGYFFTNPFIIINDKTGYLWCKNISGEQISATKIIFTLSYTK